MRRILTTLLILLAVLAIPAGLALSMWLSPASAATGTIADNSTNHRTHFLVTAWNESTDRAAPPRSGYIHDLLSNTTSGWVKAPSNVYFGAEWYRGTADPRMTRTWIARHPGLDMHQRLVASQTGGLTDTVPIFEHTEGWHLQATYAHRFHGLHGAAGVQVHRRRWTVTRARVDGYPVAFVSLHLTQRCNRGGTSYWCRAKQFEIAWVRDHIVPKLHAQGRTVVLGGDLNTLSIIRWGRRQDAIHADTMQVAAVPAAGITAHVRIVNVLERESYRGLWTDHHTPRAKVVLTGPLTR